MTDYINEERICSVCKVVTDFYGCYTCDKCHKDVCNKHMHVIANAREDFEFIDYDAICTFCLIEELQKEIKKCNNE